MLFQQSITKFTKVTKVTKVLKVEHLGWKVNWKGVHEKSLVGGLVEGQVEVKAILRTAYRNQTRSVLWKDQLLKSIHFCVPKLFRDLLKTAVIFLLTKCINFLLQHSSKLFKVHSSEVIKWFDSRNFLCSFSFFSVKKFDECTVK